MRRIGKLLIAAVLMLTLTLANAAGALAFTPGSQQPDIYLALGEPVKATADKITGKVQETIGNITGDRETQIEGKVKQAEGNIRAIPSDPAGNKVDRNKEAIVQGKTQQAESNIRRFQARD